MLCSRMEKIVRKLPQARHYLRAARWGIDEIVQRKPMDAGFMFHIVGILASLRAVQHALINADSKLSPTHKAVIAEWLRDTPLSGPEISFIKSSRDMLLKAEHSRPMRAIGRAFSMKPRSSYGLSRSMRLAITSTTRAAT